MRRVSILIGACMVLALVLNLIAQAPPADLDPVMKEVGPTNQTMNKAIAGGVAADVAREAEKLQGLFRQAEAFFKSKGAEKAAGWSKDNHMAAAEVAKAAKMGNLDAAKTAAAPIGKSCKTCHEVHREQLPDKTYKFKMQ